ncbi:MULTISPECIES: hypothetical protein [unclassified Streptomyces]|uniref:hypothetical protein n=1 Tax=unclassified Streptomyces TaxID=2593676 RepID=UPI002DD8A6D1|nr:hypothetical protein [Streptomyces sp. NBC_01795]WSA94077.1 hypothetical protein OIE63_22715 [Streptomyces sp. NBC_01795]WSS42085.1 hypothetical protein OG220_16955 [Streptomyces sp. NBC_01187]
MSRSKKLIATCALTLGVLGAAASPALAGSIALSERNSTSVPERNATFAPISSSPVSVTDHRTASRTPAFHLLDRNATLKPDIATGA